MHPSAWEFLVGALAPYVGTSGRVVEFGAQDLGQGSPRSLFPFAQYTGVDLVAGPGVDVVADAADWEPDITHPPGPYDVAISAEMFEHSEQWREVLKTARKALKFRGVFVVTCASYGRKPHSAAGHESVPDGEYYGNVGWADLREAIVAAGFHVEFLKGYKERGDVYAVATATS